MNELIRLPKYLASSGVASRRVAETLIVAGRVKVNGIPVREPGRKIDPRCDRVEVDNIPVETASEKKYYLLFKPRGYLTTVRDPFGRPTVMDLFPEGVKTGLFPVGRLDMDTEGLLLLTNDGEMAFRLTHPRFQIEKKYLPGRDYDGNSYLEAGGFWQRQGHIYRSPFYYIDYTLAQVCAFQYWIKHQTDRKAALDSYLALCRLGGSKSFLGLIESAKLKNPFVKGTVKEIVKPIRTYLDSVDDTKL